MKLVKNNYTCITHAINPNTEFSFCGLVGKWSNRTYSYKFFDGTSDQVNCGTCKVMAHNYVLRKLKGETYG